MQSEYSSDKFEAFALYKSAIYLLGYCRLRIFVLSMRRKGVRNIFLQNMKKNH